MLPWLLLALALGAGAAFLMWRRRPREAFADARAVEVPEQPMEPPAQPQTVPPAGRPVTASIRAAPAAAPARAAPMAEAVAPPPPGIVTTRLRPWLDVAIQPIACLVDGQQFVFDFEIGLQNSGSGAAADIVVEASLFNAGPAQEQNIANFFARGRPQGDPLGPIAPLQQTGFRTSLVAPRASIQTYEVGGREVFVPVIAINALYRWGSGEGQTSASYLIGRETGSEKLAPVRADVQPRPFGGLGARLLPSSVRR